MPKNSSSKSRKTKTIRMDKKQFAIMMFLTPAFAAVVSVLLVLMVFVPFTKTTSNNSTLEVPTLGNTTEETTENVETTPVETETPVETTAEPGDIIVQTEIPATKTKIVEKKSTNTTTTTKTSTNKSTTNTNSSKNTSTKTDEKKTEEKKETTPSAKDVCEARTDGPKTHIIVSLLNHYDQVMFKDILELEDPVVLYKKYTSNTPVKMVYKNNSCIPTQTNDFELVENEVLETKDLASYKIEAKSYEIWQ